MFWWCVAFVFLVFAVLLWVIEPIPRNRGEWITHALLAMILWRTYELESSIEKRRCRSA